MPIKSPIESVFPVKGGWVTDRFGAPRFYGGHKGLDIAAQEGARVLAIMPGKVFLLYPNGSMSRYGSTIIVQHSKDLYSLYAHLSGFLVAQGQEVAAGQPIGLVGTTAASRENPSGRVAAHLHLEILDQWPPDSRTANRVNPEDFLTGAKPPFPEPAKPVSCP